MRLLASNFLMPNATFLVYPLVMLVMLVMLAVVALLVIWPLTETVVRRQGGYPLGVVLLGPIGGLIWFFVGRREGASRPWPQQGSGLSALRSGVGDICPTFGRHRGWVVAGIRVFGRCC